MTTFAVNYSTTKAMTNEMYIVLKDIAWKVALLNDDYTMTIENCLIKLSSKFPTISFKLYSTNEVLTGIQVLDIDDDVALEIFQTPLTSIKPISKPTLDDALRNLQSETIGIANIKGHIELVIEADGSTFTTKYIHNLGGLQTATYPKSKFMYENFPVGFSNLTELLNDPVKFHNWFNDYFK